MSNTVNLNKFRKEKDRAEKKAIADANSVKFGRTKAQRLLEAAQADHLRKHLNAQKFEDE